ncbi:hypothetical protein JOQ06_007862 [Pogonophryne albipinna]|nr:hypothetical protein JOQ06_007862 [Pogonophryne albipinna]
MEAQTTLTTNDIVISKLTQILSYLRQGTRHKKIKKKDKGKLDDKRAPEADISIFEDIGDYIPSAGSSSKPPKDKERHRERERERERERDREREREKEREEESKIRARHSYFEKPEAEETTGQ